MCVSVFAILFLNEFVRLRQRLSVVHPYISLKDIPRPENIAPFGVKIAYYRPRKPAPTDRSQKTAQVSQICRNFGKINALSPYFAPFPPENQQKKTGLARKLR